VSDKQQSTSLLTGITRSGKSFNILNQTSAHDSSLPFLNNSVGSPGTSARLHHTTVHHHSHHHHHHGAAAATARSLRREKTREGSVKSSSKDTDTTNSHHLYQQQHHQHSHNTSGSSIVSNSHQYPRSKSFFTHTSSDSINKAPTFPMKPSGKLKNKLIDLKIFFFTNLEALTFYGDKLTEFEKTEIFDYNEIYFLGLEAEKISATNAKDYDDENGSYMKMSKDHIFYRFEILETLGKGSFGLVLRCYDHKKKEAVALKIIRNKKRFQQQGLVEVNILTHLRTLDSDNSLNVVHIKEHFYFRSHLCITFELLG
jgi:hypothetical protein